MAPTTADAELLDRYAASRDEAAFAELARRHLGLVYAAAVRRVGDRHLAEDVAQATFVILATKPNAARKSASLGAWLLTTVRYAAANALKIERRRRRRESAAAEVASAGLNTAGAASANPADVLVWQDVAAQLDDAVLKLPATDRRAVLMRFFEQKSMPEIAAALRVSEPAARQRLSRSVEKLRVRLNRRGGALAPAGAAGLASMLTAHAVVAAPPGLLAVTCMSAGVASGAAAGAAGVASITIAKGATTMMTLAKIKTAAAVVAVASVVGTGAVVAKNRGLVFAQSTPAAPAAGAPGDAVRQTADARVKAAMEVVAVIDQRLEAGEALTPTMVELKAVAQRRVAEARIDAATSREERLKAAREHIEQIRAFAEILKKRYEAGLDVSRVQLAQANYYVADAEYVVAKLEGAK